MSTNTGQMAQQRELSGNGNNLEVFRIFLNQVYIESLVQVIMIE